MTQINLSIALDTPWFMVEELAPDQPANPFAGPYYRVRAPDGVLCMALTENDEFLMVNQFRPATQQITLEFPSGSVDRNETALAAIKREVCEETGYVCDTIVEIAKGRLRPDRYTNYEYFFLGVGAKPLPNWQSETIISRVLVPRSTFRHLILGDDFEQIAVLGIVTMAQLRFGVHLFDDSLEQITDAVTSTFSQAAASRAGIGMLR